MIYELCEEYKVWLSSEGTEGSWLTVHRQSRNVRLFITHLRPRPLAMFAKAGIFKLLGDEAFQLNVADAMTRVEGGR